MVPPAFSLTFAFAGGACVGSFLNVVAWRVPLGKSIVWPGSHCPACGSPIAWFDNIPILSYLVLGGRCRNCGGSISARYAAIELLTAVVAVVCIVRFGVTARALSMFALAALLIALSVMDLEAWVLPAGVTRFGTVLGLFLAWLTDHPPLRTALVGALVGWATLTTIGWIGSLILKAEALGSGDPPLLGMIGAFLGWPSLLPVLLLASLQGSAAGLFLLALRGRAHGGDDVVHADGWVPPANAMPFGFYLSLGALEYALLDLGRFNPVPALFLT
jgi:leader peptidase (prepilin peptidase) / N-methyltransferase